MRRQGQELRRRKRRRRKETEGRTVSGMCGGLLKCVLSSSCIVQWGVFGPSERKHHGMNNRWHMHTVHTMHVYFCECLLCDSFSPFKSLWRHKWLDSRADDALSWTNSSTYRPTQRVISDGRLVKTIPCPPIDTWRTIWTYWTCWYFGIHQCVPELFSGWIHVSVTLKRWHVCLSPTQEKPG